MNLWCKMFCFVVPLQEFKTSGSSNTDTSKVVGSLETKYKRPEYGLTFTEKWNTDNTLGTEITIEDQVSLQWQNWATFCAFDLWFIALDSKSVCLFRLQKGWSWLLIQPSHQTQGKYLNLLFLSMIYEIIVYGRRIERYTCLQVATETSQSLQSIRLFVTWYHIEQVLCCLGLVEIWWTPRSQAGPD